MVPDLPCGNSHSLKNSPIWYLTLPYIFTEYAFSNFFLKFGFEHPSSNTMNGSVKNDKARICDEIKLGERARVAKTFDKKIFLMFWINCIYLIILTL